MLRRTSSRGERRHPTSSGTAADTASTSSAPTVSATLSQLGAVTRPVDLDRVDIVNQEPSQCNLTQVAVAGGRRRRLEPR